MIVSVVFKHKFDSKEYQYMTDDDNIKLMDDVLVPVGEYGHIEVGTVVAMWHERVNDKHSCFPLLGLKGVIAIANVSKLIEMMENEQEAVRQKYDKLLSKLV